MTGKRHAHHHAHPRRRADDAPDVERDHRKSRYDPRYRAHMVRVLPGEYYTTGTDEEMIVTVLGSCVAACIRDPRTGYGGMNHFMLPESSSGDWNGSNASMRYGNYAMEALINDILKSGCLRQDLEIKLFGGANVAGQSNVGSKNADFALSYLEAEGLRVVAQDLGGMHGRRIHYVPSTGKVQRVLLKRAADVAVVEEERQYQSKLKTAPVEGDIELFE
jgi:chemotaxis protein CheD